MIKNWTMFNEGWFTDKRDERKPKEELKRKPREEEGIFSFFNKDKDARKRPIQPTISMNSSEEEIIDFFKKELKFYKENDKLISFNNGTLNFIDNRTTTLNIPNHYIKVYKQYGGIQLQYRFNKDEKPMCSLLSTSSKNARKICELFWDFVQAH